MMVMLHIEIEAHLCTMYSRYNVNLAFITSQIKSRQLATQQLLGDMWWLGGKSYQGQDQIKTVVKNEDDTQFLKAI